MERNFFLKKYEYMNDEKKYTVIIPFIGNPSIAFKKSLTKNLKSINKQCCTIFKTFKVQNYFSLKDETPMALLANVIYLFEGSCDKNRTYIGKTKRHFATRVREHFSGNSAIFYILSYILYIYIIYYLSATHVIILPLRIFIFCHMVNMILIIK